MTTVDIRKRKSVILDGMSVIDCFLGVYVSVVCLYCSMFFVVCLSSLFYFVYCI